jgi:hypothetical protein
VETATRKRATKTAEEPELALTAPQIDELAKRALERDERLRREASAVGVTAADLAAHIRESQTLASPPVDVTGAVSQRRRERERAADRVARMRRTGRRVGGVYTLFWVAGVAAAALDRFPSATDRLAVIAGITFVVAINVGAVRRVVHVREGALASADEALDEARAAVDAFRLAQVADAARALINENADGRYRTTIADATGDGLAEIEDVRRMVRTEARDKLDRLLTDMPGGSIGLSGPRGSGKSSLIRAVCPSGDEQPEGLLGVVVSAPVQFGGREFILHLFAELCRAVLGRAAVERLRAPDPLTQAPGRVRPATLAGTVALLALLAGAAMLLVHLEVAEASFVWALAVIAVGAIGVMAVLRARLRHRRERRRRLDALGAAPAQPRFGPEIEALATARLTDIWFQQSFTRGWSGSVSLPIGVEAGVEGSHELARQQMSLPDVVAEMRHLVERLTGPAAGESRVQVRIGIDEMDKIDSLEDAGRFMNELKVLFGIAGCFFLVSVSEDAMSQFERRGLPLRDVFDSSFDEIVRVGPLTAERSVALLGERTIGMPLPFMLLCHVMAGGLPRDVIRMARAILEPDAKERSLAQVTAILVRSQVQAKVRGTLVAAGRLPEAPEIESLREWLQLASVAPTDAKTLLESCESIDPAIAPLVTVRPANDALRSASERAQELLAYFYFCATVQQFFVDQPPVGRFREIERPGDPPLAQLLADAHQAFTVHPRAAWAAVADARRKLALAAGPEFPLPREGQAPPGATGVAEQAVGGA